MNNDVGFNPDWISPPGETMARLLFRRGVTLDEFANRLVGQRHFRQC